MTNRNQSWNESVVEEFRANGGVVGGRFAGHTLALVHHVGRRSGQPRINPLSCLPLDGRYAIFGSAAGRDRHPDWYHNVLAQPEITIEIGTKTIPVRAREAVGAERDAIWDRQKQVNPEFAEYEARTQRSIPVVVLEPR